jgi:lysophospholipase L1-like esterase
VTTRTPATNRAAATSRTAASNRAAATARGTALKLIQFIGDSKTRGTGDSLPPNLMSNGFPYQTILALNTALSGGFNWQEALSRIGVGGITVALMQASIDLWLIGCQQPPDYVVLDLGVNDVANGQGQVDPATWESNMGYIVDACHTKWPSAKVYQIQTWASSDNGQTNALDDTWKPAVIAAGRAAWCFLGPDERITLKGSDNGASETLDGTHPNRTGSTAMGAAIKTALGF